MILDRDGELIGPPVWVSFQDCADAEGRLRLDFPGTLASLASAHVRLAEGMTLLLYEDHTGGESEPEFMAVATASFDEAENTWYATDLRNENYISELTPEEFVTYVRARHLRGVGD